MATELILIRHGHTVRVKGDYVHAPLTQLGQEQAAQTGRYLSEPNNRLDGFYSSPLRRTQETAKIIGEKIGQSAELRTGMQELRLIELPALAIFEILSILDPVEDYLDDHAGRPIHWPIAGRVSKVLLDIVAKHPDQRVAVISHSGVISAALSWYLPERRWRWWRTTVGNCSITRFKVDGNRVELLVVNDVQHLNPAIVTTQPPAPTVEIAEQVHPVEKALEFDKMPDQNEWSSVAFEDEFRGSGALPGPSTFRSFKWTLLPQMAEPDTPQPMDAVGELLLYDGIMVGILSMSSQMTERWIFQ